MPSFLRTRQRLSQTAKSQVSQPVPTGKATGHAVVPATEAQPRFQNLTLGRAQRLQRTLGNQAVGRLLTATPRPNGVGHVQRMVVTQAEVPALTADLDTSNGEEAKALINNLWDRGQRTVLATLYSRISAAGRLESPARVLAQYINAKLQASPSAQTENKASGFMEKMALSWKYPAVDEAEVEPAVRVGLRMWVSGDPQRGITWNVIGEHLRGRLDADSYQLIGYAFYMLEDQRNGTHLADTYDDDAKRQMGRQQIELAKDDIHGALDALPAHDGLSYRQAGVANKDVYGGVIQVGDYIRDAALWSTSALRISGSAGGWGTDGTADAPKVYFIITGSTGRYISKHAAQEEGQHEVLFKAATLFQVTKMANYQNHTFFVHLTEVDPTSLVAPVVKNPYSGATY